MTSTVNLSELNGNNGFVIGELISSVSSAGDVNGDGIDDVIIGAYRAAPNGSSSGESYVVFGSGGFASSLDLSSLDGSNGFVLNGIDANDISGTSVSSAGDVNGDGIDDIIIGASFADPNGSSSGESYVVFGSGGFSSSLDLSSLDGSNGFVLNGIDAFDNSGTSVSSAGDVNGDGIDDVIIGARGADPNGSSSGESYVVFGSGGFSSSLDLSSLDGSNGFVLNGIDAFDNSGTSVSSAGDVNGDGIDDIIIGARGADPNGSSSGESYVVFGSNSGFTSSFNLSSLDGSNGFVINGIDANDISGTSVSSAGDVNGDGIDDVIIGARGADPNGSLSGESYVVFGSSSGFDSSFNLSSLDGSNGFVLNGIEEFDNSGVSVSSAGDVNGDGFDDVIIGAYQASPNGYNSGESYVVFGSGGFSSSLDLSSLDGSNGFVINGIDEFDRSGYSVSSAGDVNGDGFDDLMIQGALYSGVTSYNSGESYVVFGFSTSTNTAPDAVDDPVNTDEDTATTVDVLANDTDADHDSLTVTDFDTTNTVGLVINNGDGTFSYDPNDQFESLNDGEKDTDSFTYTVFDGTDSATATVTVTIDGLTDNSTPTGDITDQSILAYDPFILDVNDIITDPDGDDLTFSAALDGGEPLPSWLTFDEATGTFSGLPTSPDEGTLNIELTADDSNGGTLTDHFELSIELPLNTINNNINGGSGNDSLPGTDANDNMRGKAGNDTLDGGNGADNLLGNGGKDTLNAGSGNDYIDGGSGNDYIDGGNNNDILIGGGGDDILNGGENQDILDGGNGVDELNGGDGPDTLIGGPGLDILSGGNNNDLFVLGAGQGRDTITDFENGRDTFLLTGGLTFDDLSFSENAAGDTTIRAQGNGVLAIVENTPQSLLGVEDFTTIIEEFSV